MTIVTSRTIKIAPPLVGKLSELEVDETGKIIIAQPLTVDGVTRTIPAGHHVTYLTAHGEKFVVENGGKLICDGSMTVVDLG